ncbi:MAG: 3-ketoacyl-ACP reductase [Candidatus Aminicenantes bacterium]|jgi:NAD(P)-dependent dehydrogenase (short-subunit alcohol dehydrogenase family)
MDEKPVVLVTGAGRGIGRGISISCAEAGFDIAGVDILYDPANKDSGLFEVQRKVEELNASFLPVRGDVSSLDDHERVCGAVLDFYGRIDALVNNAGIAPDERKDILETTVESYDRVMSVNARGTFFLTQRIALQMIEQTQKADFPGPCILFISSVSAEVSSPNRAEYCISKAALSQAARIYADRLSEFAINVYEIRPGIIQTEMTAPVREKYDKLIKEGLIPQKRWGYPEDVGKAVVALAKGYFGYSTGLILELSGGMNIRHL